MWVFATCMFFGCGNQSSEETHNEKDGHEETEAHAGEVKFTNEMAEAVGLKTKKTERAQFTDIVKTSGRVMAAQGEEMTVVATVPGIVRLGNVSLVDGTSVSRGQSLLTLTSKGLPDGDVTIRTRNAYETARQEYERMKALVADKIVSAKDFEQARLSYENAKTAWEAISGKQAAGGVSVAAPMSGYLKNIQVQDGDYVSVGQSIATVSQNNRLVLRAEVSEKYYSILPMIQSANFKTPYDERLYELSKLHGKMLSYGKSSDSNSFYVPVSFEFDNKGAVIPGSFVEIYLLTSPIQNVISIPVSSLIEEQGLFSVYVREHEEMYRKVPVKVGLNNGADVQILSGLKEGEEVVTEGSYQIKLASASNAIPAHSHSH